MPMQVAMADGDDADTHRDPRRRRADAPDIATGRVGPEQVPDAGRLS